ncbi:MAG: ABC transporter substrate-binding protein [Myxococcaceae bacterium]
MKRLLSGLVFLGLAGCGGGAGPQEETIKIGALASATGELASTGLANLEAMNLAVAEINAAGGVLGRKLEIVHRDDGGDPVKAKAAAEALVTEEVKMVVGAQGSAFTLAGAEVLSPAGIPQISPSSTSPLLTVFEDDGYLFRACPSDAFQGKLIAQRSRIRGHQTAAVLFSGGPYGEGFANAFKQDFEAAGGTVFSHRFETGQTSFADLLAAVFENSPDAIVLVAYPVDGPRIVKEYITGFPDRGAFWFFGDAIAVQDFVDGVGASGFTFSHEGTVPALPSGARFDAFAGAYQARYGKTAGGGTYAAQAYDAVYLAALAMEQGGKAESAAIRDALRSVSAGGTPFGAGQFKDAVAAIKAGQDIDYDGASGPVDFDEAGDVSAPYDIWQVKNGAIVVTEPSVNP